MIEIVEVFFFVIGEPVDLQVVFFGSCDAVICEQFSRIGKSLDSLFDLWQIRIFSN